MADGTVYIRNGEGGVQAVTQEHYDKYLTVQESGRTYPRPGFTVLTPEEAEKERPQLFGAPDTRVVMTSEELARALQAQKNLAEFDEASAKRRRATKA